MRRPVRAAYPVLQACAIRDDFSNKIVGYAIGVRMKASLAVRALRNAIAQCQPVGAPTRSVEE